MGEKLFNFGEKALTNNVFFSLENLWKDFLLIWAGYFQNLAKLSRSFAKTVLYLSRGLFWKKLFLFWWKPNFLSGFRKKSYCFLAKYCRQKNQNRILSITRHVHGLWLFSQNWTNIIKRWTKFAIFASKTHPSRGWHYINKLLMEVNNSAAG